MAYTVVVQYVPDAVTDERINIGVVVLHEGCAKTAFLSNWQRVRQFAGKDVAFLKDLQKESKAWDAATVLRLSSQWTGSIQFAAPRFTTLDQDSALFDGLRRYLAERSADEPQYRHKTDAVRIVKRRIRETLIGRLGAIGREMIKGPSYQLKGRHLPYEFDISVGNGRPLFAAQGISFEVPSTRRLDKEIAATAWLIEDVKLEEPDFPILVGALPPKERFDGDIYEKASALFSELGADVIGEDGISSWAEEQLMSLPSELYPRRRP